MRRVRRADAVPGACELAEWNVPHAPNEHRSLLVEIDEGGGKGLAGVAMIESGISPFKPFRLLLI